MRSRVVEKRTRNNDTSRVARASRCRCGCRTIRGVSSELYHSIAPIAGEVSEQIRRQRTVQSDAIGAALDSDVRLGEEETYALPVVWLARLQAGRLQ